MICTAAKERPGASAPWRVLAAAALVAMTTMGAIAQPLNDAIERVIGRSKAATADIAVSVMDVDTGQVLAGRNATRSFIPASNMKLITTGTALLTLGPDFRFRTEVLEHESRLVVRGGGDPSLGDPELLIDHVLGLESEELLRRMAAATADRASGPYSEIIIDDRVFDRTFVHPTWKVEDLNRRWSAEVAGVNFHANILSITASPSESVSSPPSLSVSPEASWIEIENRGKSVRRGQNTMWLSRPRTENTFTMFGDVRFEGVVDVAYHNAPRFFGELFVDRLSDAGVRVGSESATPVRLADATEAFADARPLVVVTTDLTDVVRRCNVDSQNLYAEALLKRVGHELSGEPGSWENGTAVIRMTLEDMVGPRQVAACRIVDGSGLSRENRVTSETLAMWLRAMARDERVGEVFLSTLPQPGEGTLTRRFREVSVANDVLAKSGYLNQVYSLSGYVRHRTTGRLVAFSVLVNNVPGNVGGTTIKRLHEDIVDEVDRWLESREAGAVAALQQQQQEQQTAGAGEAAGDGHGG